MSSLPQSSILNMPPLERSHTDYSPSSDHVSSSSFERVSPHTYRAAPGFDASQYQNHHLQLPQQYNFIPTPPYVSPSSYIPFGPSYPIQPGMSFPNDFSAQYYSTNPLPTIPPRFSASDPINMPGRATGCVSPLDLFGTLPSAQSLPTRAMHIGAFGGRSLGFGQQQMCLDDAVELDDEVEAEMVSAPELLEESPVSSEADSTVGMEEIEEEPQVIEVAMVEKPAVKKGRKIRPAEPGYQAVMNLASPPRKGKVDVEGAVAEGKEGKKRSRTAQACEKCRVRKARCFGGNPCNRCIKRKFVCEFTPTSARSRPLIVKPEITTAAKPKARRHSMSTVPAAHARTLPPTISAKPTAARVGAAAHPQRPHHAHSQSMNLPRPRLELGAVHPYLRPTAPTINPAGSISTSSLALHGMGGPSLLPSLETSGVGLGLGLSLGLDFTPPPESEEIEYADPSPGGEGDSDPDMPGMTNSFSGSSAPASNSGSGAGSAWSSLFPPTDTTTGTPSLMGEDDMFQFSPVQGSEFGQLQLEWAAGVDPAVAAIGAEFGGLAYGGEHGLMGGLAGHGAAGFMPGEMEWYQNHQSAGFRA